MMNSKRIIPYAIVLAVVVVLIVVINALSNRKPSEGSLQFFAGISAKNIGAVVLKDAADRVKIQRRGDVWMMIPNQVLSAEPPVPDNKTSGLDKAMESNTGNAAGTAVTPPAGLAASEFPADSGAVAQLLDNIVKIKKDILISENPARQADFEVNAESGNRIEVFDVAGMSRGAVVLGKSGSSYNTNYIRPDNTNSVYLARECNRWAFNTDHKRWTDKSIMRFDKASVQQLSIAKKGAPEIVLEKSSDTAAPGWRMLKPAGSKAKKIDSNPVNEILNTLSTLNAQQLEDSAYTDAEAGLVSPAILVTVTFQSGTVRSLAIGGKKPSVNALWVRVPEKQYLYLLNEDTQKRFDKKPADFYDTSSPPASPPQERAIKETRQKVPQPQQLKDGHEGHLH